MLTLEKMDVLDIHKTNTVRNYKSETEGYKDKTYRVYAYNNVGFAVHEDDDFHTLLAQGKIYKVSLAESDEGLSLVHYVTTMQVENMKRTLKAIERIDAEPATVQLLNPAATYEALS